MSEAVHWLLYAFVLTTTMTGWLLASERGWSISLFFAAPLPMLTSEGSLLASGYNLTLGPRAQGRLRVGTRFSLSDGQAVWHCRRS